MRIPLPVWYALPVVVGLIAYAVDAYIGTTPVDLSAGFSLQRFAIVTALWCFIEGVVAGTILIRRRMVAAAIVLLGYLLAATFLAVSFGSLYR